jgi:hypothetical protein
MQIENAPDMDVTHLTFGLALHAENLWCNVNIVRHY